MEDKQKNDSEQEAQNKDAVVAKERPVWKKILRVMMWILFTPVALFLFISILIYLPPIQRVAVDWAAEYLSEETDMDVSVGSVSLGFPLNLVMGDVVAVQKNDTILNAGSLDASVRMMPLFHSNVEIDNVCLRNVKVNTRDMVEACLLNGVVGELGLNSHSTSLSDEKAVLSNVWLKDADLFVVLADSVPENTTESGPVTWKVALEDISVSNVKLKLRSGMWSGECGAWIVDKGEGAMNVCACVGTANVRGYLNLAEEVYNIYKVRLDGSSLEYDKMVSLSDVRTEVDSIEYRGIGDMRLVIKDFFAREKNGMCITSLSGHVFMDSVSLSVPDMNLKTEDSNVNLTARMDFTAFDSINPGTFDARLRAQIGKGDLLVATKMAEPFMGDTTDLKDVRKMLVEYLPVKPVELDVCAEGNMNDLSVNRFHVYADKLLEIDATARLANGEQLTADATGTLRSAHANLSADYNLNSEAYNANLSISEFRSSDWMRLDEPVRMSGSIVASGKGLDVYSAKTIADVRMNLPVACIGKIDLSSTKMNMKLRNSNLVLNFTCDNDVLKTAMELNGIVKKHGVDANLDMDLPLADIHGMGLYDDVLKVSTQGQMSVTSNLDNLFRCEAHVDGFDMRLGEDSILTQDFNVKAETTVDSTYANLTTGDLSVDFHTPYNLFKLTAMFDKLGAKAMRQLKNRDVDIDELKTFFPYLFLNANIGTQNPLATVLKTYGVSFSEMKAKVDMGPERGVTGDMHLYSLRYDTIRIDTTYMDIYQDSRKLTYNAGVVCSDQPMFEACSAYLDGYIGAHDATAHLTFFDKKKEKGLDLGVHATGRSNEQSDTLLHLNLFPAVPVIAYREFGLNKDNYVIFCKDGHIDGDVRLHSLTDKCIIALSAGLNTYQKQWANAVVENLNLEEIAKVLPFMPKMTGMMYMDAMFNQNENDDNFWAGGSAGLKDFTYEGMHIGNLETDFDYQPEGLTKHNVQGQVVYNGVDVAYLNGKYNAENDGYLDASLTLQDIPVELFNPFIPDQLVSLDGNVAGVLSVSGHPDALVYNGDIVPSDVHVSSDMYSVRLALANDTISIKDNKLMFNRFKLYGAGTNPLTVHGNVDFSNMENMGVSMGVYGRNFKLIEAKRTGKSVLYGDVYADFFSRISGTVNDLRIRGMLNILSATDVTYIMTETPLSQGDRLDDIVTFVDFTRPPEHEEQLINKSFVGVDMQMTLTVEDGAKFNCEFSADRQSYVNIQGGGTVVMKYTPEGVLTLQGRLTVNEGEMKYTLPVIPLKTFTIENGSYIEFTGEPFNPTLNIAAVERTKATVSSMDGASRSVAFDVGMKIFNTLQNMGLEFTIEAPEDISVQNELAGYSKEEKNKLAVALLATGMYLSNTNTTGFSATNALNNFLQNEINNIAGQALATTVSVEMGMEQTTRDEGSTRTDYSFKFSKRFFSDRLNVIIGGKVSSDGGSSSNESGAYIDDVSLEWRLDNGGSRYVRLFHEKDYSNLIEGELDKNGAGIVLRKKVDNIGELFQFGNKNAIGVGSAPAGNTFGSRGQTTTVGNTNEKKEKEEK